MRALSLVALLLMLIAMLGLLAIHSLFSPSPVAIAIQCAGFALMVWARATFGGRSLHAGADPTAGGLVTTGPYHFIRHPIYTAACVIGWAGIAVNWSLLAAVFGILLFAGALGRMLCEERLVAEMYPAYREYARVTKRMIPYAFAITIVVASGLAASCSSSRPSDANIRSSTTSAVNGVAITDEMIGRSRGMTHLTRAATDPNYGYSEKTPIKIGGGFSDGSDRAYKYLNALRGPNGETVNYTRVGTCCSFEAPSSPFGRGLLEVFELTQPGAGPPKRLYFNWHEEGELLIPAGLSAVLP